MLDPNTHDIELMHVWVVRSFKVSIQFEIFFFTSKTTNQTKTLYTFKAISVFIALFFFKYVCLQLKPF